MPAASDAAGSTLPATFRPFGVRIAVAVLGALLFLVVAVTWVSFPESVRDKFTLFQRLTIIAFGVAAAVAGFALARSRVEARADGLHVVNGYRSHHHAWGEVSRVVLSPGSPWAILQLADGSTAPLVGIQGSDGARAVAQVQRLNAIMNAQGSGGAR